MHNSFFLCFFFSLCNKMVLMKKVNIFMIISMIYVDLHDNKCCGLLFCRMACGYVNVVDLAINGYNLKFLSLSWSLITNKLNPMIFAEFFGDAEQQNCMTQLLNEITCNFQTFTSIS